MAPRTSISRRDFLKLLQVNIFASIVPIDLQRLGYVPEHWPALDRRQLPLTIMNILERVPSASIDAQGYLVYHSHNDPTPHRSQTAQTLWNKEHSHPWDRLDSRFPWGIVLHWYGDKEHFDRSIPGYLRGFDSLRKIDNFLIRTSAHFVVGDADPVSPSQDPSKQDQQPFGILQTQLPDRDGVPFVASHLRPINYLAIKDHTQYFILALSHLARQDPANHSLLHDLFLGPRIDPNMRTIAIEIAGHNFDTPAFAPPPQKIANVVALVWALMKRYHIPACHILGHHEITLGKPDPGKKFLALVRYLIGIKALAEPDLEMKSLVFNQFLDQDGDFNLAVSKYFRFIHDYQVMVSTSRSVYEWESWSNYWLVDELLHPNNYNHFMKLFTSPMEGKLQVGVGFLHPSNHEGIDLIPEFANLTGAGEVLLTGGGECVFTGKSSGGCPGKMIIMRHVQPDGARILTVFNHLQEIANIQPGHWYPSGIRLGILERDSHHRFLHFAVAYGSTWDTDLCTNPDIPRNAGPAWIRQRYLDPTKFINTSLKEQPRTLSNRFESN